MLYKRKRDAPPSVVRSNKILLLPPSPRQDVPPSLRTFECDVLFNRHGEPSASDKNRQQLPGAPLPRSLGGVDTLNSRQ